VHQEQPEDAGHLPHRGPHRIIWVVTLNLADVRRVHVPFELPHLREAYCQHRTCTHAI
jgi:hypothetical protein